MSRIVTAVAHRVAEVRRLRRRNTEKVLLRLEVPAEIAEVGHDALALAATVRDPDGRLLRFHAHEGRFVEPVEGNVRADQVADYFGGRLRHLAPPFRVPSGPGATAPGVRHVADLPAEVDAGVREMAGDDGEAAALAVRRHVGGHLLVEGLLWRGSAEPYWSVTRQGEAVSLRAATRTVPGNEEIASFRLDRAACADRYARAAAHRRRRRYDAAEPQVLFGGVAFGRDDRLEAAAALGRRVVELLPEGWLRLLPAGAIVDWCRLRDDLAAGPRGADDLARRAYRLIDAVDGIELNANGTEDRSKLKRHLADAVARFGEHEDPLPPELMEASDEAALAEIGGTP